MLKQRQSARESLRSRRPSSLALATAKPVCVATTPTIDLGGGGQGRKDKIEKSGVYRVSEMKDASPDAMVHGEASWGQGERGAAGYEDSGGSELINLGEELGLIGGVTEGESRAYKRDTETTGGTIMKCKEIMTKDPVCSLPGGILSKI